MKYAPIIVLIILALGIAAVTVYRPHGRPRAHSFGAACAACIGFLTISPMRTDKAAP